MGYPVYKLIRAVNRQYPNNGFINYVDVREDMYDSDDPDKNKIIDEDLRDLINEAIQETYINIAVDEVYSFPTVRGQNQYVLPDDCDLRDIQEVTRTFWAAGCPIPPPHNGPTPEVWFLVTFYAGEGATGEMDPVPVQQGEKFTFPECEFIAPTGTQFMGWDMNGTSSDGGPIFQPGDEIEVQSDLTITAIYGVTLTIARADMETDQLEIHAKPVNGTEQIIRITSTNLTTYFIVKANRPLSDSYEHIKIYDYDDNTLLLTVDGDMLMNENKTVTINHYTVRFWQYYDDGAAETKMVGYEVTQYNTISSKVDVAEIQVAPRTGYTFLGWSLNGTTVISNSEIMNTKVSGEMSYKALFSS